MIAVLLALQAYAVEPQTLRFEVAVPPDEPFSTFTLELTRLGTTTSLALTDDVTLEDISAIPYDGVFVGSHTAAWSRYVVVQLSGVNLDGEAAMLYVGIVRTDNVRFSVLGWQVLRSGNGYIARRVAGAYPGNAPQIVGGMPLVVASGWGLFVLVYGMWLVAQRREKR